MLKAVVIDFDDTLCLTEAACFAFENALLATMGRNPQTRKIHKETWGQSFFDAMKLRSPGINISMFMQLVQETLPTWVADSRMDHLPIGRLAILDKLLDAGYELYILTSRTRAEAAHLLEPDHHLAKRIKAFYWREKMKFHKPDPRAFDLLLQEHGLTPQECVYVGDSPSDAAAAKQAGLHFIASLEAGLRTKADFKQYAVDAFINHLEDLPQAAEALS